jgi:23S rRNA (cytidine1920-2'-O)/16S rRNA (cytidine1409-2'-O)-methyltransferase
VAHVIAVDVAYGELAWVLRSDPRVTVIERRNARSLHQAELAYAPDLIVVDVSFISLAKVLPAVLACAAARFDCLALIKPQFEVGKGKVGKGGIVRDEKLRREAVAGIVAFAESIGLDVVGTIESPVEGAAGNREYLALMKFPGQSGK